MPESPKWPSWPCWIIIIRACNASLKGCEGSFTSALVETNSHLQPSTCKKAHPQPCPPYRLTIDEWCRLTRCPKPSPEAGGSAFSWALLIPTKIDKYIIIYIYHWYQSSIAANILRYLQCSTILLLGYGMVSHGFSPSSSMEAALSFDRSAASVAAIWSKTPRPVAGAIWSGRESRNCRGTVLELP